ncbi:MAG: trypsin-like serine protease, partial [Planctomycetota bacterium]
WSGCAVLIAPDVVVTAKHVLIAPRALEALSKPGRFTVRFRRHANGTLGSEAGGADSYHHVRVERWVDVADADLAIGLLVEPVEHIKPARVLIDVDPFQQRACVIAGWGSTSRFKGANGPRPGLRIGNNKATTDGKLLRFRTSRTEQRADRHGFMMPYFIEDHAVVNMQDSGGALFVLDKQDRPVLAGILATYRTAVSLVANNSERFPLEAAIQGGAVLKAALGIEQEDTKEREADGE